eukprot:2022298-Pyramimonas_sp.AAC.1
MIDHGHDSLQLLLIPSGAGACTLAPWPGDQSHEREARFPEHIPEHMLTRRGGVNVVVVGAGVLGPVLPRAVHGAATPGAALEHEGVHAARHGVQGGEGRHLRQARRRLRQAPPAGAGAGLLMHSREGVEG